MNNDNENRKNIDNVILKKNNNRVQKKKIIISMAIIIIIIIIGVIIVAIRAPKKEEASQPNPVLEHQVTNVGNYVGELSDGTQINTNAKMNQPSTLDNFSINNIRLTQKNGITTFRANVTNAGNSKTELKEVTLILLDENGKELVSADGLITETEPAGSAELAIVITSDYINACGYKLVAK